MRSIDTVILTTLDEFKQLSKIETRFIGLQDFAVFYAPDLLPVEFYTGQTKSRDAFNLMYIESKGLTGVLSMRIYTPELLRENKTGECHKLIIEADSEVFILRSSGQLIDKQQTLTVFDLPLNLTSKLKNASIANMKIGFSNETIVCQLSQEHLIIFKAFEEYCFGSMDTAATQIKGIEKIGLYDFNNEDSISRKVLETKAITLLHIDKIAEAREVYQKELKLSVLDSLNAIKEIMNKMGKSETLKRHDSQENKSALVFIVFLAILIYIIYQYLK